MTKGMSKNKEWVCIQVTHHKRIAKIIHDNQEKGWELHTYQSATDNGNVTHFLLFKK